MELVTRLHRGDPHRRAVAVALLVALLTLAGGVLPAVGSFGAPAAGADQISSTQRQIAELQTSAVSGAQRIRALTLAYNQATFQVSTLNQEVTQGRAEVRTLQERSAEVSSQLRRQALDSYTGAYTGVPSLLPAGAAPDLVVRAAYVSVASGSLKDSVDQVRATRRELSAAQAQLAAQQRQSGEALAAVGQARLAALAEAAADQSKLDTLQSQLTSLIAAQKAEQAAQARAAAAAAKPATQGLPVNGGLVAVVQSAVTPAPAPAAPRLIPTPTTSPPATTVAPGPTATPAPSSGDGGAGGVWLQLRQCESGDNYQANTGNGFFGAYQFSQDTWTNLGYPGRPDLASPGMQDAAAQKLQAESGWGQWPACSAALGLS